MDEQAESAEPVPLPETSPDATQDIQTPEDSSDDGGDSGGIAEPDGGDGGDGEVAPASPPDWEAMLGYVGQQANDQLFDGIAIRLAESTHRIINRTQDRFEQHMAELDIGNSY